MWTIECTYACMCERRGNVRTEHVYVHECVRQRVYTGNTEEAVPEKVHVFVCTQVYVRVCVYTCVWMNVHKCTYVCGVWTSLWMCADGVCVCRRTCVWMSVYECVYVCGYVDKCAHECVRSEYTSVCTCTRVWTSVCTCGSPHTGGVDECVCVRVGGVRAPGCN